MPFARPSSTPLLCLLCHQNGQKRKCKRMSRSTTPYGLETRLRTLLPANSGKAVLPASLPGLSYPEDLHCLPEPASDRSKRCQYPKRNQVSHPQDACKLHHHRGNLHSQWALEIHHSRNESLLIQHWQLKTPLHLSLHLSLLLQDRTLQLFKRPSQHLMAHPHRSRVAGEALVSIVATSRAQTTMLLGSLASLYRQPTSAGWPTS